MYGYDSHHRLETIRLACVNIVHRTMPLIFQSSIALWRFVEHQWPLIALGLLQYVYVKDLGPILEKKKVYKTFSNWDLAI